MQADEALKGRCGAYKRARARACKDARSVHLNDRSNPRGTSRAFVLRVMCNANTNLLRAESRGKSSRAVISPRAKATAIKRFSRADSAFEARRFSKFYTRRGRKRTLRRYYRTSIANRDCAADRDGEEARRRIRERANCDRRPRRIV